MALRAFLTAMVYVSALFLFVKLGLRWVCIVALYVLLGAVYAVYILFGRLLLERLRPLSTALGNASNAFAGAMERLEGLIKTGIGNLRSPRAEKRHAGRNFLLYVAAVTCVTVAIQLPDLMRNAVSPVYRDALGFARRSLLGYERHVEAFAGGAPALWVSASPRGPATLAPNPSGTVMPTPTPAPQPRYIVKTKSGSQANVRIRPSSDSKIVAKLQNGEQVIDRQESDGNWIFVETQDGETGWIHNSLLESADGGE